MNDPRCLIVNADDFGRSPGVNRGIALAHDRGVVTSASLMVRWPAAAEAAEYARSRPSLSLGLHVDLCEWVYRDDEWQPVYQVVQPGDREAIAAEVGRQLDAYRRLTGRDPSHLDSHQHVHRDEPLKSILTGIARDLMIPVRGQSPAVRYCGEFYGQTARGEPAPEGVGAERLIAILKSLPTGTTELGCHPGLDPALESCYLAERAEEVKALCDARVRSTIEAEGIVLRNFHDLGPTTRLV